MSKDLTEALRAIMEGNGTEKPEPMPARGNVSKRIRYCSHNCAANSALM